MANFQHRGLYGKGYCIIKEVNELHKADAPNAGEGTAERGADGGRDTYRELLPFFNVRDGQEMPSAW